MILKATAARTQWARSPSGPSGPRRQPVVRGIYTLRLAWEVHVYLWHCAPKTCSKHSNPVEERMSGRSLGKFETMLR